MKKIYFIAFILVCIAAMYFFPRLMISPGALLQAHQEKNGECLSCHTPFGGISNEKCISCHALAEIGINKKDPSKSKKLKFHEALSKEACSSCHTDHKGAQAKISLGNFNHNLLSENIMGSCVNCHGVPDNTLHQQVNNNCKSCHNTTDWKQDIQFDHAQLNDKQANCSSCHNAPKDELHGQFSGNCDKCHSNKQWKPSTFEHNSYFVLDGDHNVSCGTCHTNNNFSMYTCYGCHEHSESKIRSEHQEEGISNFSDCASCHKSANEHDIRMPGNENRKVDAKEQQQVKDYLKKQEKEENDD